MVHVGADYRKMVQVGAPRYVQNGADWCRIVQNGAGWYRIVQDCAD